METWLLLAAVGVVRLVMSNGLVFFCLFNMAYAMDGVF